MKTLKTGLMATAFAGALVAGLGSAHAVPQNVGGVLVDPDAPLDLRIGSSLIFETVLPDPPTVGVDTLTGIGQVTDINGNLGFCPGCELTFRFTYTVASFTDLGGGDFEIGFDQGEVTFFVDDSPDFGANLDLASATDGDVWLTLVGHVGVTDAGNFELGGDFEDGVQTPNGVGNGFLDVAPNSDGVGVFNPFADTDTIADGLGGTADLNIFTQFTPGVPGIPGFPLSATGQLSGDSIPEPGTLALLGVGLAGFGFMRRRMAA